MTIDCSEADHRAGRLTAS